MQIKAEKQAVKLTMTLDDREIRLLACLIGSLSGMQAEEFVRACYKFGDWVGNTNINEMVQLTGLFYDTVYEALEGDGYDV
jgi:hypothetical protein